MPLKVLHERWKCIGCAACASITEKFWVMDDEENKADLVDSDHEMSPDGKLERRTIEDVSDDDKKDLKETSEICPVECIHVEETKSN